MLVKIIKLLITKPIANCGNLLFTGGIESVKEITGGIHKKYWEFLECDKRRDNNRRAALW